jgi:acyl-CoA reductase-like NAD-dependent aldehyde dehydrogenase
VREDQALSTPMVTPKPPGYVADSEEEAVDLASATRYGLGANVFEADIEHAKQVAAVSSPGCSASTRR